MARTAGSVLVASALAAAALPAGCAKTVYKSTCEPWTTLACDAIGPASDVVARIFLLGDAGEPTPDNQRVLTALDREIAETLAGGIASSVLFLGDNVYPDGLRRFSPYLSECGSERDGLCSEDVDRLEAQLSLVRDRELAGFFLPGNHDWGNTTGSTGLVRLANQQRYLARHAPRADAKLVPPAGCPGPVTEDLRTRGGAVVARVIFLDTQWLLMTRDIPAVPAGCPSTTRAEVLSELRDLLAGAADTFVVLAAHHPLRTESAHGGNAPYPHRLANLAGVMIQDLNAGPYRDMIEGLESAFDATRPPDVYAAGHDHVLQVLWDSARSLPHLVSGSGSYLSPVRAGPGTRFAAKLPGYMRLDFAADGGVHLYVVAACAEEADPRGPACTSPGQLAVVYSDTIG